MTHERIAAELTAPARTPAKSPHECRYDTGDPLEEAHQARTVQSRATMEGLVALFVHLLVLILVFGLLYWVVSLIISMLPPPIAGIARVILLVLMALIAISFLLGEVGLWGDWGWGYHHHRL